MSEWGAVTSGALRPLLVSLFLLLVPDWPFRSCSLGQPNCRRFSERVQRQQASATPTAADRGPLRAPPAQGNLDPCGCYRRVTFQGHDDGNFLYYTHEVLSE